MQSEHDTAVVINRRKSHTQCLENDQAVFRQQAVASSSSWPNPRRWLCNSFPGLVSHLALIFEGDAGDALFPTC